MPHERWQVQGRPDVITVDLDRARAALLGYRHTTETVLAANREGALHPLQRRRLRTLGSIRAALLLGAGVAGLLLGVRLLGDAVWAGLALLGPGGLAPLALGALLLRQRVVLLDRYPLTARRGVIEGRAGRRGGPGDEVVLAGVPLGGSLGRWRGLPTIAYLWRNEVVALELDTARLTPFHGPD